LRENGCPWNSTTSIHAAWAGQLEVLQRMRENDAGGEVWDENLVLRHATGPREQEVLTWLDEYTGP
jgi:hypothetical protein